MGDRSGIEWTDATWNPVVGCEKVSPGCDNCYAISMSRRIEAMGNDSYQGLTTGDDWTGVVRTLPERLDQPLRWKRPRRVFVNSMSDLFHPDVPWEFIYQVFAVMRVAEQHQFQILTKRPKGMYHALSARLAYNRIWNEAINLGIAELHDPLFNPDAHGVWPFPNVWLGTSIEEDKYTFRARQLVETPAAVRFLSLEPLLGDLPSLNLDGIDWVIVGGESGLGARWMHPAWVQRIRDLCQEQGVPFFFKQWGAWAPRYTYFTHRVAGFEKVGKKKAGRELDGRTWDEYPDA